MNENLVSQELHISEEASLTSAAESVSRRKFVALAAGSAGLAIPSPAHGSPSPVALEIRHSCRLKINGEQRDLQVDTRTTLLDLLRENLQMPGTKKGCDHGQCGACTVLVNGKRINSCLSLAIMNDGLEVTTIEGLSKGGMHPVQTAFIENDALQCGYCTPGQICSAVAMLEEVKRGSPSAVTVNISRTGAIDLTDDEIRERMSGNICRCGAYVGIVAAIRAVEKGTAA